MDEAESAIYFLASKSAKVFPSAASFSSNGESFHTPP
jgi:hypothetical protein